MTGAGTGRGSRAHRRRGGRDESYQGRGWDCGSSGDERNARGFDSQPHRERGRDSVRLAAARVRHVVLRVRAKRAVPTGDGGFAAARCAGVLHAERGRNGGRNGGNTTFEDDDADDVSVAVPGVAVPEPPTTTGSSVPFHEDPSSFERALRCASAGGWRARGAGGAGRDASDMSGRGNRGGAGERAGGVRRRRARLRAGRGARGVASNRARRRRARGDARTSCWHRPGVASVRPGVDVRGAGRGRRACGVGVGRGRRCFRARRRCGDVRHGRRGFVERNHFRRRGRRDNRERDLLALLPRRLLRGGP